MIMDNNLEKFIDKKIDKYKKKFFTFDETILYQYNSEKELILLKYIENNMYNWLLEYNRIKKLKYLIK